MPSLNSLFYLVAVFVYLFILKEEIGTIARGETHP